MNLHDIETTQEPNRHLELLAWFKRIFRSEEWHFEIRDGRVWEQHYDEEFYVGQTTVDKWLAIMDIEVGTR